MSEDFFTFSSFCNISFPTIEALSDVCVPFAIASESNSVAIMISEVNSLPTLPPGSLYTLPLNKAACFQFFSIHPVLGEPSEFSSVAPKASVIFTSTKVIGNECETGLDSERKGDSFEIRAYITTSSIHQW